MSTRIKDMLKKKKLKQNESQGEVCIAAVNLCNPQVSVHASDEEFRTHTFRTNLDQNSRASRLVSCRCPRLTLPRCLAHLYLLPPSLPPSSSAGSVVVQVRCSRTEAGFDGQEPGRDSWGRRKRRTRTFFFYSSTPRTTTPPPPPHTFLFVPTPHIPSSPLRNLQ